MHCPTHPIPTLEVSHLLSFGQPSQNTPQSIEQPSATKSPLPTRLATLMFRHGPREIVMALLQFDILSQNLVSRRLVPGELEHRQRSRNDAQPALHHGPEDNLARVVEVVVLRTVRVGVHGPHNRRHGRHQAEAEDQARHDLGSHLHVGAPQEQRRDDGHGQVGQHVKDVGGLGEGDEDVRVDAGSFAGPV